MEYRKSVIITTYSSFILVFLISVPFFLIGKLNLVYAIWISYLLALLNFVSGVFISATILRITGTLAKAIIPIEFFVRMALTGILFFLVYKKLSAVFSLSLVLFAAFVFLLVISSMLIYLVTKRRFHQNSLIGQEK